MSQTRTLFLCTGNSCRSQMAEGFLNRLAGDRFEAYSAGSNPPGAVHPLAIKVMAEMGIDISQKKSKNLDIYLHKPWDMVITVCDKAKENCPVFPGQKVTAHWSFEDPAEFEGTEEQKLNFFRKIAKEIQYRIRLLIAVHEKELNEKYQAEVRNIGNKRPE